MGIDFSKFSKEIQAKIKAALEDKISPNKVDAAELRAMNLEKEIANQLMQELCGNSEYLGDGYVKMQNKNKTLVLLDKPDNNSFIPLTSDSLNYYRTINSEVAQGLYNDGVLYLVDSKGHLLKDKFNNYITEKLSFNSGTQEPDEVSGNFEVIENEPPERTNRRFAVAIVRSMYNEVINELNVILSQMGVLDAGLWREMIGMGVQAIADLKSDQEMITATTKKKIERIETERDNICNSLNELIDSPEEFKDKFYQLIGKDYKDRAIDELREIQHEQSEKDSKTKFKECISRFEELYPDNNISRNIESWEDSVEFQKTVDEIANIVIMLVMTGGIGKMFQGSVQTFAKNILLAAAKGDKKAVFANFAKLAPEVQTVWKSLAKKEFGVAAAQITSPMAQSSLTMGTWEGAKAFLNNLTNAEEMTPEEVLRRTLEGLKSGAEMGVIMGGLEVAAIAPVMTKLTPVLNKLTGAATEITAAMEKGNGIVSMEKIMETYIKANEALRGKIVKEGAHSLVALPILTMGFTATDTFLHYNEAEFKQSLLDAATTDEEREAINKMTPVDLRMEFAKTDFIGQVKGMATIEGVGIMFRRLQAGRIAVKSLETKTPDILGANLREVKENGKTSYEICTSEGELLSVKNGKQTITRFSSIAEAAAAYSAMCTEAYAQLVNLASGVNQGVNKGVNKGVKEEVNQGVASSKSKIDFSKVKTEHTEVVKGQAGQVSLTDETGLLLGVVNYNIVEKDGVKSLNFEGLKADVQGQGVGTKLLGELVKISEHLGAEGRLTAEASPMGAGPNGTITNIEFYYKLGFKAIDPKINDEICSYIVKGEPVPIRLNVFTKIELDTKNTQVPELFATHVNVGNKMHELKLQNDVSDASLVVKSLKAEIEALEQINPQKAEELQIVLDMFTNPTEAKNVTDKQIDAVVNYLDEHYAHKKNYFTTQTKDLGLQMSGCRFSFRLKGLESTRDKVANYIADSIKDETKAKEKGEKFTPKTLLDAFNDVRDKYACRTVFKNGDFTKHPDVSKLIKEAEALDSEGKIKEAEQKMHEAELKAAEIQSESLFEELVSAMEKAKNENADLSMMRISNYASPNGIPIFSERQLAELKREGAPDINVEFIKLAKYIDPKLSEEERKLQEKKLTTKAQPSGYTALQINFVTKTGEVIEWQYRGELVDKFAEAEHLPYDLRTGKNPWKHYPELEQLYKTISNLLGEDVMPKGAYKQLNKYFTDYYTHLRRLELGFESKEPRLENYQRYVDEEGVTRKYKFDKRLEAKNLEILHNFIELVKQGGMSPEAALKAYNAEVGYKEAKQDTNNPIHAAKPLTHDEMIKSFRELGLSDNDIERVNTEEPMLSSAIELIKTMKEYNPEKFGNFPSGLLVNMFNHPEKVFNNEDSPFLHYATRDNVKALLEVAEFEGSPLEDMNFWQDTDVSQLYRMSKHYFDVTGEKFPIENVTRSNKEFRTDFPTDEQVDVALRMKKAELWSEYAMLSHSMDVESPQKVNDQFVAAIKELKAQAKAQGIDLSIEYGLNDEGIELINRIKEYNDKSPIDFQAISKVINNTYLHPKTVVFYLELQEKGINVPPKMLGNLLREIDSAFSSSAHVASRKDMAMFFIEHQDIYNSHPEDCNYAVCFADANNIELTKTLLQDKEFPKDLVYRIQQSVSLRGNLPNYKATDEEAVQFVQNKAKFAQKLCLDKTLNCPKEFIAKLIENYYDGCEETVIKGIKTGLLDKRPRLINYPADCWENILKRNLTAREVDRISRNLGYSPVLNYARAKDDNIVEKHARLRQDALDNKDLLKSGMEDISDWEVGNVTGRSEAIRTLDLIGLSNTEAAFPLMLEEFGEFLRETSELSETKLSDANKELLMERVNPINTQKAKNLQKEITKLKKQINKAVGEENLTKIKDIQTQKSEVDASISDLKTQLDNARMAIPEYKAIADKMVNLNQKSKEYKEYEKQLAEIENQRPEIVSLKNSIKEQQKQSKALNGQAQSVYYSCENATEVKELMKQLSPKQKELKEYLAQYSGIEPQEVVTKVRVLSALSEISTEEEMANIIKMIKPSSAENNAVWNEAVNKKIFQKLGIEYDETLSQKLDLINCKYISKMFISNEEFFENMRILVDVIKNNPELSVMEAIDRMPQNTETKRIFEELGFDYEKFTKADKNSFTSVTVKLSADEAKQASIHNLEEDLNDALFKLLPQKATEPIFKQLKDELGVEIVKSQKDNWEGDGFNAGTTEYYRLYKNGRPIAFEDMDKIITLIKREINKNDFWTRTQGDEELDNARKTMYTHLIKMRTQEVDNALNIKNGEVAEIEVRKTDMYDIKKALGLGNDAQCCTALGRNMNEWSAPTYIMNKCVGAIELSDKGSFVGNTMIYLAYVDGKPALILDNIELKTKYQNNDKIRDTFMEYAKKLCAEIGQPALPIYAGPNRHKLNMDIYPKAEHSMEIIGNSGEQEIYADYDASPHFVGQGEKADIYMYRIR